MGTIRIVQCAVVDIAGHAVRVGSLTQARTIAISDDELVDQVFAVAPETAVKIWDKAENEAMGGFDFLWLESDLDVLVQFTTSAGVSDAYDVKTLKGSGTAGVMGPAIILGSNATQLLDGSIDTFEGTSGTVDEVWVYNPDTSNTARVRMLAAT